MLVYRISKNIFSNDLTGTGAGLFGGRWNPKGINLVYTTSSISLATLEYLVHNFHIMQSHDLCLTKIQIGNSSSIELVNPKKLPKDWNEKSYLPVSTQQIGADFFTNKKHYILKVPSAIVPGEFNYLLNPFHPKHTKTKIIEKVSPFHMPIHVLTQLTLSLLL